MILACADANSKLVEVVTVADVEAGGETDSGPLLTLSDVLQSAWF